MTQFEHNANVHPDTVTEYSQGEHHHRGRARREELSERRPYSSRVIVKKIHPAALEAADYDSARIELLEDGSYFIHNHRDWRKRQR